MTKAIDYSHIAELYDVYVKTVIDIPFFLNEATKCSGGVLELMAGTGRVSIPLIEAGVRLTCVDKSPQMLKILRQKLKRQNLSAHIYEMDVCTMSLGKDFELIIIPFHSFAEILTTADQHKALASIYQHLAENGRFICTLHNPAIRLQRVDGKMHLLGEFPMETQNMLRVWTSETYNRNTHLVGGNQIYEIYNCQDTLQTRIDVPIIFYMHGRNEFEELISSSGFVVTALYGDYSYARFDENSSPFMIFVLDK